MVELLKTAKYDDLFKEIKKSSDCPNCANCEFRKQKAELFVVSKQGEGIFILFTRNKLIRILKYVMKLKRNLLEKYTEMLCFRKSLE